MRFECRLLIFKTDAYRSMISFRREYETTLDLTRQGRVSRRCSSFPTRSPNDSQTRRSSCTFRARHVGPRVNQSIISTGGESLVVYHCLSVRSRVRVARSSTDLSIFIHLRFFFRSNTRIALRRVYSSSSSSFSSSSPPPSASLFARYLLGSIYVRSLHRWIGQ